MHSLVGNCRVRSTMWEEDDVDNDNVARVALHVDVGSGGGGAQVDDDGKVGVSKDVAEDEEVAGVAGKAAFGQGGSEDA